MSDPWRRSLVGDTTLRMSADKIAQTIEIDVEERFQGVLTRHYKDVVDLKEKAIRQALINLGWTPPAGP